MFTRLKDFDERTGAEPVARRGPRPAARAAARRHPGRARHSRRAAGDSGPVGVRRLPVRGARPDRRRHQRTWPTSTQQIDGQGQPVGHAWPGSFSQLHAPTTRSWSSTIDRDRARSLGLPIREVTDALSVLLGSQYVNDFDFNNRAYRVYVQADQRVPRAARRTCGQFYARASNGADGAARHRSCGCSETTAPAVISHFNLFRSTEITGIGRARASARARRSQAMEQHRAARRCRRASTSPGRGSRSRRSRPARRRSTSSR